MGARSVQPETLDELTPSEQRLMMFCVQRREDMVYLIDVTTAHAGLPRSLQGQWFDTRLLTPGQKSAVSAVTREVNRALRRLFRLDLVDVGREETFPEGFKRHHREIVAAMQTDEYWRGRSDSRGQMPSMDLIEQHVRFHQRWADITDLRVAAKELGGPVELIGLTPAGRRFVESAAGKESP